MEGGGRAVETGGSVVASSRRLTFLRLYVSFPFSSRSTTTPPPASMRVHPEVSSRASRAALTHTSYSKSRNHAHPRASTMSGMLIPASSTIMSSRLYSVKRPSAATRRRHSALFPHPRPPMRTSAGAGAREEHSSRARARGEGRDPPRLGSRIQGRRARAAALMHKGGGLSGGWRGGCPGDGGRGAEPEDVTTDHLSRVSASQRSRPRARLPLRLVITVFARRSRITTRLIFCTFPHDT